LESPAPRKYRQYAEMKREIQLHLLSAKRTERVLLGSFCMDKQ
jgi:hypothetical protein